jgi:uncharacterized protein YkwD
MILVRVIRMRVCRNILYNGLKWDTMVLDFGGEKMIRTLKLIAFIFLLTTLWPVIENKIDNDKFAKTMDRIQSQIDQWDENPTVLRAIDPVIESIQSFLAQLNIHVDWPKDSQKESPLVQKPELQVPAEQTFSIHNVELGYDKSVVEQQTGPAKRETRNEYGLKWHAYHKDFHNFFMAMYDSNNKVVGLYTNQDLIASKNGIRIGTSKEMVLEVLGNPMTGIQKGMTIYQFQEDRNYDVFELDGAYVTVFYDKYEGNTVTAMQIISEGVEQKKRDFYTKASQELSIGFEYQMFDLTNATRVQHQLPILIWDDHVSKTARKHSLDMAEKQYFDHTNLEGESPFDRMKEDHVNFRLAGENLAYGQFSSIFAHEGLMNSYGHRKNILQKDFEYLGVGVAFNEGSHPYYTQNYYAN